MDRSEYIEVVADELESEFPESPQHTVDYVANKAWEAYDDGLHEVESQISAGWKNLTDPESLAGQVKGAGDPESLEHCWNTCVGKMSFSLQVPLEEYKF